MSATSSSQISNTITEVETNVSSSMNFTVSTFQSDGLQSSSSVASSLYEFKESTIPEQSVPQFSMIAEEHSYHNGVLASSVRSLEHAENLKVSRSTVATSMDDVVSSTSSRFVTPHASPTEEEYLLELLPPEMILDLKQRVKFVKAHYLQPAMQDILSHVEAASGNTELLFEPEEPADSEKGVTRTAHAFLPKTRPRHGSLLHYFGNAIRQTDAVMSDSDDNIQVPTETRKRSGSFQKAPFQTVMQLTEESGANEQKIHTGLKQLLQSVSQVRPVTEQEVAARLKRLEEPFDVLERLLNEQVQLLLEEISIDAQMSISSSSRKPIIEELPRPVEKRMSNPTPRPTAGPGLTAVDEKKDSLQIPPEEVFFKQKRYPKHVQKILYDWLRTHFDHPYPTKAEKEEIARLAGISPEQVGQWFTNARRRIWKPFKTSIQAGLDERPSNSRRRSSSSVGSSKEAP